MSEADVVVAGAGHNSLIAAAYLAVAGFEVLVLEDRPLIGGNTVTEELTLPGFLHDSCSSAHVIIQSNPLIRNDELGLGRYGLEYRCPDPATVMPFPDGDSLTMWQDAEATADEIAHISQPDARAYVELLQEWETLKAVHARVTNHAPEPLPAGAEAYARVSRRSAWDIVHERFTHPKIRAFLLWMSSMTIQPVTRPGTGILPFSVTGGRASYGWTTPVGGSGALPRALAALITDQGGRIVTDARVTRILVEGGRAVGVETAEGGVHRARRAVLSTVHVAQLPELLDPGVLPPAFIERVERWDPGHSLFAVHLALSEAPRYRLRQGPTSAVAAGLASLEGIQRQLDDFDEGRAFSDDPLLLVVCSSLVDPTRAPDGQATLKLLTVAPYQLHGNAARWDEHKERYADALVRRYASVVDGFEGGDELARVAESPLDLERRNRHNHRGSCHGGALGPAQAGVNRPVPGWSGYRLPVAGLYQTGATTHPGGSVSGRPGRNAARVLLTDLGVDAGTLMSS